MPRYAYPEPTIEELIEKISKLEEITTFSGLSEPLVSRVEKTLFTPSATKTSLVTILLKESALNTGIEIYDGKGNHLENIISTGKLAGELQLTTTIILGANESWEWRLVAGGEAPTVFSTYWFVGGIGSQGPTGEKGKEGPVGEKGEKGERGEKGETGTGVPGGNVANRILGTTFGNVIEWLNNFTGNWTFESLEVGGGGLSVSGVVNNKGGQQYRLTGQALANIAAQGILELLSGTVLELECPKATTIEGIRTEINTKFGPGTIVYLRNKGSFNMEFLNTATKDGFQMSTGANVIVEPKHTITLVYNLAKEKWFDIALR